MPARSPTAIDATFMLLGSVEYPAFTSAVQVSGSTPFVVPHRKASQSLKPLLYTSPGSAALLGLMCPAPWRKTVSYTHLRAHETPEHLVCRLLLEKKKKN